MEPRKVIKLEQKELAAKEFLRHSLRARECHADFKPHMAAHAACEVSIPEAVFVREDVA